MTEREFRGQPTHESFRQREKRRKAQLPKVTEPVVKSKNIRLKVFEWPKNLQDYLGAEQFSEGFFDCKQFPRNFFFFPAFKNATPDDLADGTVVGMQRPTFTKEKVTYLVWLAGGLHGVDESHPLAQGPLDMHFFGDFWQDETLQILAELVFTRKRKDDELIADLLLVDDELGKAALMQRIEEEINEERIPIDYQVDEEKLCVLINGMQEAAMRDYSLR